MTKGSKYPPIIVVACERTESLSRLLNSLNDSNYPCNDVELIISVDETGTNNNKNVKLLAENFVWKYGNKTVVHHEKNLGLRNHFIECADYSIKYNYAIVFEDDILPSPNYYNYTVQAIEKYKGDKRVIAISLYSPSWNVFSSKPFSPLIDDYDAYLSQIECSWGECYIGEEWTKFKEWYSKNDDDSIIIDSVPKDIFKWKKSYSKFIISYINQNNKYYVTPYKSLSTNYHDAGIHSSGNTNTYQVPIVTKSNINKKYDFPLFEDAVKYGTNYNNFELKEYLQNKYQKKVIIDFYGSLSLPTCNELYVSCKLIPYKIVDSFSLTRCPWEQNIYDDIKGNELYIYDLSEYSKNTISKINHIVDLAGYFVRNISRKEMLIYSIKSGLSNIMRRSKK